MFRESPAHDPRHEVRSSLSIHAEQGSRAHICAVEKEILRRTLLVTSNKLAVYRKTSTRSNTVGGVFLAVAL